MPTSLDLTRGPAHNEPTEARPTLVLVHGALTDASVWSGVVRDLQARGHAVVAPSLPLRSLAGDVATLAAVLDRIPGPVVLAGHSYGGTVVSHPRIARDAVKALVFVAAFQPEAGESTGALNTRAPGSRFDASTAVVEAYPGGDEISLRPEAFAEVYAQDLPPATAAILAASQRPLDVRALTDTFEGTPTWRRIPSWAVVATEDRSLPPVTQRFMAERARSQVLEVRASHAVPLSRPDAVADVIDRAAREVRVAGVPGPDALGSGRRPTAEAERQ